MKLIFLDFDGVLNSTAWHSKLYALPPEKREGYPQGHIDPDAVAVLNEIVQKTGALVVVSSTWRIGSKRTWLQEQLNLKGFKGRVLSTTPVLGGQERGVEIQNWLDNTAPIYALRFGPVESFVILDDDTDMAHLYNKLVHIDYATGLVREHLPLIMKHLEAA